MRLQEILCEKFDVIQVPNGRCIVHDTPTPNTLLTILKHSSWGVMRGIIDGKKIYWFDAERATHDEVAQQLGIDLVSVDGESDDDRRLILSKERDGRAFLSVHKNHRTHRQIEKLCHHDDVVVESVDDDEEVFPID